MTGKTKRERYIFEGAIIAIVLMAFLIFAFCGHQDAFAAEEPSFSGYISTRAGGDATPDRPTYTNVTRDLYLGEGTTRPRFFGNNVVSYVSYSGLEPGKTYAYRQIVRSMEGGMISISSPGNARVTASDTGEGTFTIPSDVEPVNEFGLCRMEFEFYDPDDPETKYDFVCQDQSMNIYLYGVSDIKVRRTDGDDMVGYGYLFTKERNDTNVLINDTTVRTRSPGAEFTLTGRVQKFTADSTYITQVDNLLDEDGNQITFTATAKADENGTVNFSHDLPALPTVNPKVRYTLGFTVRNNEDPSEVYTYQLREVYYFNRFYGPILESIFFAYDETKEPKEDPTYVNVAVSDYISGTKDPLVGAKLRLVKGTDTSKGEVIGEWEENGTPRTFKLEPGDYTIVQLSAPDGYKTAKPKQFSLVDKDSDKRGSNFIAYTESIRGNDVGEVDIFHLYKDGTDSGFDTAYCINRGLTGPTREAPIDFVTAARLIYKEYDIEDPSFYERLGTPRLEREEMIKTIKRIAYSGYPNDKAGILSKYGLSKSQFSNVTQCAIHHYTDSTDFDISDFNGNQKLLSAYQELIKASLDPPEDMTLKYYLPNSENYQALVATEFRKKNIVINVDIYNGKTEEEKKDYEADDPDDEDGSEGDGSGDGDDSGTGKEEGSGKKASIGDVRTGDSEGHVPYMILALIAVEALALIKIIKTIRKAR